MVGTLPATATGPGGTAPWPGSPRPWLSSPMHEEDTKRTFAAYQTFERLGEDRPLR